MRASWTCRSSSARSRRGRGRSLALGSCALTCGWLPNQRNKSNRALPVGPLRVWQALLWSGGRVSSVPLSSVTSVTSQAQARRGATSAPAMVARVVRICTNYPLPDQSWRSTIKPNQQLQLETPSRLRRVGEQQGCRCFSCMFEMAPALSGIPTDHVSPPSSPQKLRQSTAPARS